MLPSYKRTILAALLTASVLALGGCGARSWLPTGAPEGSQAPVNLRSLELASADGHRAVLLRLSRLPTLVRHTTSTEPAQIIVQAWGPQGGGDLPERTLPQDDPYIRQVTVSREKGALKVVFDLNGDIPPPHMVHEMADWIMVRFGAPAS